jgi:hypothetical protein
MTTRERFARMYAHQEADRVPITDVPWNATIERWQREGMPADINFADFFDSDCVVNIHPDSSPRFPARVLEETDEYLVQTTRWGGTERQWKHAAPSGWAATPEQCTGARAGCGCGFRF